MQETKRQNRAFLEMRKAALERLSGKSAEDIAGRTGLAFHGETNTFSLFSLGKEIRIGYPQYDMTPELNDWHHLLVLHYLDMADGAALSGELMAFGEQSGGMVRGGGFDRESERILSRDFGNLPPEQVEAACRALGSRIVPSNADLCAVFDFFPRYPITLKLWFADEEIPGSGRLMLDKSAGHFLSVEDAVTAGTLLLEELSRACWAVL